MTDGGLLQVAVLAQTAVIVLSGGLTATHFLYRLGREATPGRRMAARALALSAIGSATQALTILTTSVDAPMALAAGLPACTGQALCALLVLRERGEQR